jgi:hypothetical protein
LIGDQRDVYAGTLRGAKQNFFDYAGTGVGVHPNAGHRAENITPA